MIIHVLFNERNMSNVEFFKNSTKKPYMCSTVEIKIILDLFGPRLEVNFILHPGRYFCGISASFIIHTRIRMNSKQQVANILYLIGSVADRDTACSNDQLFFG